MKNMVTKNMVIGLPKTVPPNLVCRGCMLGKHHQKSFDLVKAWRAQERLELVHSDLSCMKKPSLASAKNILTVIDDLSLFTLVYLLNNKIQVFEKFKEFRELAEKRSKP